MGITHLDTLRTEMLSGGGLLPLHQASVRGKLLHTGKTGDVFAEVFEDLGLVETLEEGRKSKPVSRETIFDVLDGRS